MGATQDSFWVVAWTILERKFEETHKSQIYKYKDFNSPTVNNINNAEAQKDTKQPIWISF